MAAALKASPITPVRVGVLSLAILMGLGGGTALAAFPTAAASDRDSQARVQAQLANAARAGFDATDMAPIEASLGRLMAQSEPAPLDAIAFHRARKAQLDALAAAITGLEQQRLQEYRDRVDSNITAASDGIAEARSAGAPEAPLTPLLRRLEDLRSARLLAVSPSSFRALATQADDLVAAVDSQRSAALADLAALKAEASGLVAANGGNLDAVRGVGQGAVVRSRNEMTLATFLHLDGLAATYDTLEKDNTGLGATDLDAVSLAAARVTRDSNRVHDLLLAAMPDRVIAVSLNAQHLWAYNHGRVVMDTDVTTGRDALPTDIGPMSVLWKVTPWKMHSPFPKGSPFYYPDTAVRKVLWFTNSGEGLHDAPWRSTYGPGTNRGDNGSHGCINMPGSTVDFLYDWAPVGTPVIVIPGDGTPAAEQVARDTIDAPGGSSVQHGS